jgi:tetratricopeptide (TPR) repeat protein
MKKCTSCSTSVEDNVQICPKCGSKILVSGHSTNDLIDALFEPEIIIAKHLNRSIEYYKSGKLREAISEIKNVLKMDSNHALGNARMGIFLLKMGKPQEAIPYLERALELNRNIEGLEGYLSEARSSQPKSNMLNSLLKSLLKPFLKFKRKEVGVFQNNDSIGSMSFQEKLFYACEHDDTLTASEIVLNSKKKIDINAKDQYGYTPLVWAVMNGNIEIVSLLAKNGANVNVSGSDGTTPLMLASSWGPPNIVRILLDSSADVSMTNGKGETAYGIAEKKGRNDIMQLLAK